MAKTDIWLSDIVIKGLQAIGADGLCNDDCGCGINDLFPCGQPDGSCIAAKKQVCTENNCRPGYCTQYEEDECEGFIGCSNPTYQSEAPAKNPEKQYIFVPFKENI